VLPFDISKLPDRWIREFLYTFLPGGVLLIGLATTHADQTERFLAFSQLNGFAKTALIVFAAYVAGFILMALGALLVLASYFSGYIVAVVAAALAARKANPAKEDARNIVWRRLVAAFLSSPIVRVEEPSSSSEEFQEKVKVAAANIPPGSDTDEVVKKLAEVAGVQLYRDSVDTEWKYLYSVLQCYFYKPLTDDVCYLMTALYALGIAFTVWSPSSFLTPHLLSFARVSCMTIALVFTFIYGVGHANAEPYVGILGARILKEWRASASPSKPPA
jgi:hypothetical protein